ncbi:hypothetical protein H8B01_42105, partial [Bradyrhizobium sp. Cham227]|nr:hypothetical protein [Bradyrhizobium brasilense]
MPALRATRWGRAAHKSPIVASSIIRKAPVILGTSPNPSRFGRISHDIVTPFAKATSHIALPLNLISAASPPILASLLTRVGSNAVLELAFACSVGALVMLAILS